MLDSQKQTLLASLNEGREALGQALAGVTDEIASRKPPSPKASIPAPSIPESSNPAWSILECVDHTVQSERYLLTRLLAAKLSPEPFEKSRRAAKIAALAADRTRRIEAPPQAHPQGHFATLSEALAAFDSVRAEVVRYLEESNGDLNCWITDHPLIPGPVTCHETLIMIAAHPAPCQADPRDSGNAGSRRVRKADSPSASTHQSRRQNIANYCFVCAILNLPPLRPRPCQRPTIS
jgi:DinB family protein